MKTLLKSETNSTKALNYNYINTLLILLTFFILGQYSKF